MTTDIWECLWQIPLKMLHPRNPPDPEIQIPRNKFQTKPKSQFEFVPWITEESEFLDWVDFTGEFKGVAFSVETTTPCRRQGRHFQTDVKVDILTRRCLRPWDSVSAYLHLPMYICTLIEVCNSETFVRMKVEYYIRIWTYVTAGFIWQDPEIFWTHF